MKASTYHAKVKKVAEREERREKRGKLEAVLIQKLQHKHRNHPKTWSKQVIKRAVAAYLNANTSFLDAWTDLRNMDFVVDRISKTLGNFVEKKAGSGSTEKDSVASLITAIGGNDGRNTVTSASSSNSARASNSTSRTPDDAKEWKELNPWVVMSLAKTVEAEDAERRERERKASKRQAMASNLNDQLAQKKKAEEAKRKEYDTFVAKQKHELEAWQEQTVEERKREDDGMKRAAKDIRAQIDKYQERKRMEKEKCRLHEREEIEDIKRKLLMEEEREREVKEQEKRKWDAIKLENAAKRKERQRQKEEEAALDAKFMAETKARLDKEEAERAQALADRLRRNEEFVKKLKESTTYQEDVEKRKQEERAVLREVQAREANDRERDQRKKESSRKRQQMINETNRKMAEEKQRATREMEKAEEAYAAKCRREAEVVLAEKESKAMRVARLKKQNSFVLKKQIEEQQQIKAELMSDMNGVERSINKELMVKIDNDPVLRSKIMEQHRKMATRRG